ncbi:hypothetical protein BRC68_02910 [Halobacteriales archaeon QH_6_64_20]|nr:MAG: hypothetical protein BRC68_02910 [Halobacteriales archaeon QH_6_64_20]
MSITSIHRLQRPLRRPGQPTTGTGETVAGTRSGERAGSDFLVRNREPRSEGTVARRHHRFVTRSTIGT